MTTSIKNLANTFITNLAEICWIETMGGKLHPASAVFTSLNAKQDGNRILSLGIKPHSSLLSHQSTVFDNHTFQQVNFPFEVDYPYYEASTSPLVKFRNIKQYPIVLVSRKAQPYGA